MLLYCRQFHGGVLATLYTSEATSETPGTLRSTRCCRPVATLTMTAAVLLVLFILDQMVRLDTANGEIQPFMSKQTECVRSPLWSAHVHASNYDLGCEEIEASQDVCNFLVYFRQKYVGTLSCEYLPAVEFWFGAQGVPKYVEY